MAEEVVQAKEKVAQAAAQVQEQVEEAAGAAPGSPLDKAKKTVSDTAEQVRKSHVVTMTHQALLVGIGAGVLAKPAFDSRRLVILVLDSNKPSPGCWHLYGTCVSAVEPRMLAL
jgi:hypothetical protein